jgi:Protein of unknown function (DUF2959)
MSLTERLIRARRLALTVGSATLMSATGYADQEALMKSVGDALTEVNATKSQLAASMSSLNALLATKPGDDLRPAYQAYEDNVDKTKQAAATTKQRVDQMDSDGANYFSSWKADDDKISNPQMHKVAICQCWCGCDGCSKPVPFFDGFPLHFRISPARLSTRHTLAGLTATMSASSIMNVSRR